MSWLPKPYPDETFYSLLVRLHCYLGRPTYSAYSRMLVGRRHYVALCHLPCGLRVVGDGLGIDDEAIDQLIDQNTLFNYHTAFASHAIRQRARAQMRGTGSSLQFTLGLATFPIRLPDRLRVCRECLAEMNAELGEVWWCRAHQLPGVEACHKHGIWLEKSLAMHAAYRLNLVSPKAPSTCSKSDERCWPSVAEIAFARQSVALLSRQPTAKSPSEWHGHYREMLAQVGLLRGTCQARTSVLHKEITGFWPGLGGTESVSRLISRTALVEFFRNRRSLAPPAQHLLIQNALSALPVRERPFGSPPYRCENPLVDHYGERVVSALRLNRDKGKLHGHFTCQCGYSYSRTIQVDGTIGPPRLRDFGPSAQTFLRSEAAKELSLRAKARRMLIDPMTVQKLERRIADFETLDRCG